MSYNSTSISAVIAQFNQDYKMDHHHRGKALIFNYESYDPTLKLLRRDGAVRDKDRLCEILSHLHFEVDVFLNMPFKKIMDTIDKVAKENHQQCDCLIVCFLSHGEHGFLYAYDTAFKPHHLWTPFTASQCPSLAGKPKMFFIQACRGTNVDDGVDMKNMQNSHSETDSSPEPDSYKIPVQSDFLIAHSTVSG
ncbi:unnamed protein product, partial [Darwinula stevensoni]